MKTAKPTVVVFGLGQYYSKLRAGIHRHFHVVAIYDARPLEMLDLVESDPKLFSQFISSKDLDLPCGIDAFMILTPPSTHIDLLELCSPMGKPVFVEKPLGTGLVDQNRVLSVVDRNPHLYCSDFYPDVHATPLLAFFGRGESTPLLDRLRVVNDESGLWNEGAVGLGPPVRIEALLLEGLGQAATFEGRDWLWQANGGGVLLDLMYHHLCLAGFIFESLVEPVQVQVDTLAENGDLVAWDPLLQRAETHAIVSGTLRDGLSVFLEVGKYVKPENRRTFDVHFEGGSARMIFQNPNTLELVSGGRTARIELHGDWYDLVCLRFLKYVEARSGKPYGLDQAFMALDSIDRIKKLASA